MSRVINVIECGYVKENQMECEIDGWEDDGRAFVEKHKHIFQVKGNVSISVGKLGDEMLIYIHPYSENARLELHGRRGFPKGYDLVVI